MKVNGVAVAVKEICCKCHLTFGSAEPRVAIDSKRVMHEDCYGRHLHELSNRQQRVASFSRHVH